MFSFVFMSNHFHFLIQDPKGELAEFMGYFQGNIAKAINNEIGRAGKFWSREYDDVILAGETEFWDRYAYMAANPVQAGLVDAPFQWGGISSIPFVKYNEPIKGKGLDVTGYNNACRHGRTAKRKEYEQSFSFELSCPPMLADTSADERSEYLVNFISDAGVKVQETRKAEKLPPCMGMKKVLAQSPFNHPNSPAREPRFKIMAFCEEIKEKMCEKYRAFVDHYRSCCQALIVYFKSAIHLQVRALNGIENKIARYVEKAPTIIWPSGCYVPTTHKPIGTELKKLL